VGGSSGVEAERVEQSSVLGDRLLTLELAERSARDAWQKAAAQGHLLVVVFVIHRYNVQLQRSERDADSKPVSIAKIVADPLIDAKIRERVA
jgi:hypothetical protein